MRSRTAINIEGDSDGEGDAEPVRPTPSVDSSKVPPHLRHLQAKFDALALRQSTGQAESTPQSTVTSGSRSSGQPLAPVTNLSNPTTLASGGGSVPADSKSATYNVYNSYNAYDAQGNRFTREKQPTMTSDVQSESGRSFISTSTATTMKRGAWAKPVGEIRPTSIALPPSEHPAANLFCLPDGKGFSEGLGKASRHQDAHAHEQHSRHRRVGQPRRTLS